jgi:hypothetical protein
MKYTVRNWAEYDSALRARGSLTSWVTAVVGALQREDEAASAFDLDVLFVVVSVSDDEVVVSIEEWLAALEHE